jgi:hypothetical protein
MGDDPVVDRHARVRGLLDSAERVVTSAADGVDSRAALEVARLLADVERETPGGAPLHSQLDTVRKWVDALARPEDHARFGGSAHVRDHVVGQFQRAHAAADDYFRESG